MGTARRMSKPISGRCLLCILTSHLHISSSGQLMAIVTSRCLLYLFSERCLPSLLRGPWFSLGKLVFTALVKTFFPFMIREGTLCSQNPVIRAYSNSIHPLRCSFQKPILWLSSCVLCLGFPSDIFLSSKILFTSASSVRAICRNSDRRHDCNFCVMNHIPHMICKKVQNVLSFWIPHLQCQRFISYCCKTGS
jgi:hypothetical protein